jgi:azurin
MNFFNLDCHISVIADIKQIFENLGHSVTSWSVSGHNWVFGRTPDVVEVINHAHVVFCAIAFIKPL